MTLTIEIPDDTLAALHAAADDERIAIEEALGEMAQGLGRPFQEFADEFSARFEARHHAA